MTDFNYICNHIRSEQVISLTLSDDNETSNQSGFGLFRCQIEQFARLIFLSIVAIDSISLQNILPNASKLKQLHSFSMNIQTMFYRTSATTDEVDVKVNQLKSFLQNLFVELLPQLNLLYLNNKFEF